MKNRLILLTAALVIGTIIGASYAQQGSDINIPAQTSANSEVQTGPGGIYNIAFILEQAGNTRFFIYAVFGLGLFFVIYRFILLVIDRRKSMKIRSMELDKSDLGTIQKEIEERPDSSIAESISMLLSAYSMTKNISVLNEERSSFMDGMKARFSVFTNWMTFLSDAAGALGLLGTVIGMFTTFFGAGGEFDNRKVLDGMGIALITTLLGIMVSLILNLFTTIVTNFHNRNLEYVMQKSDEFRLMVVHAEQGKQPKTEV